MSLDGAAALVTGASGGIGSAVARMLSGLGAGLCLVGRRRDRLEATAAGLPGAMVVPTDLTSDAAMDELVCQLRRRFGDRLDVLVHCAGMYRRGSMATVGADDFDRLLATNVRGPHRLTAALLPELERCRGQVVFVNSTQGLRAGPTLSQYAASQHAVKAFADSLRQEVNEHGVRVLTVHVGRTATALQEEIFRAEGRPYEPAVLVQPEDVATMIGCCLTLPRTAEVIDLTIRPMTRIS